MVNRIRSLLGNALKNNDSLYFAVLTECLRISRESIFTGLNNLKVHTISDVRYDEYFGFTDSDVYCPWDVINYCDELLAALDIPPRNYWANTSGNDLILRLLEKADSILTSDRFGIVIELKYVHDGKLETACAEALKQIEEKKYAEGLERCETKKIIKYGIAFCEKECMVVMA